MVARKNGGKKRSTKSNEDFNAEKFVDRLLDEGTKIYCSETTACDNNELPPFYDEYLYKKGQEFFYKHLFAMFYAKLNGLMALLAIPPVLKILMLTKKSSTDFTAYLRYMSTVLHMTIWYTDELKPGSNIWKSLSEVNLKHDLASKKSCAAGFKKITQKDMAFTQFGFMGFQLARSEMVGIHYATEEELKAFIHVWRVIGYLMGIEDRFNICRDSVQETKEICNILITKCFYPQVNRNNKDYLMMSRHLVRGMWARSPALNFKVMTNYLCLLLKPLDSNNNIKSRGSNEIFELGYIMKWRLWTISITMTVLLRYTVFRWFFNFLEHLSMWLMEVFPFLAYYSFGKANSIVKIKL